MVTTYDQEHVDYLSSKLGLGKFSGFMTMVSKAASDLRLWDPE